MILSVKNIADRSFFWGKLGGNLKNAKVLVAGAGGLRNSVSPYLAIAEVGKLILADFDSVHPHNLNRQFIHHEKYL